MTGDGDLPFLKAPVASQDHGGVNRVGQLRLLLRPDGLVVDQLIRAQALGGQLVRILADLLQSEALPEGLAEYVQHQVVEGVEAAVHVHRGRHVLGALGMSHHADAGLVDVLKSPQVLEAVINSQAGVHAGVAHVLRLRGAGAVGGQAENHKAPAGQLLRHAVDRAVAAAGAVGDQNGGQIVPRVDNSGGIQRGLHHRAPGIKGDVVDLDLSPVAGEHVGEVAAHQDQGRKDCQQPPAALHGGKAERFCLFFQACCCTHFKSS